MENPHSILKKVFGYDSFRPGQEQIVQRLLAGQDVLAVMPTGAGKSICYQVPALLLPGITIVVSPLVSLMKDQVGALVQAGVAAAFLNNSLTDNQKALMLHRAREGWYKIIYVAPERLEMPGFQRLVQEREISMVTVDEAHCISQWGQDFRPSYLRIRDFVASLPQRPVVGAFTATATAHVRDDIREHLALQKPYEVTTSFDRPNLYFETRRALPSQKPKELLDLVLKEGDNAGIVYCSTTKQVDETARLLQSRGIRAAAYHAKLDADTRRKNQDDFLYDRVQIMVATNAFGMGIDKPNVRFVIHYNMPKDLESYYQEAGRAGRDGEPSECILYYEPRDVRTNRLFIENGEENSELDEETRKIVKERDLERLKQMTFYCFTSECLRQYILNYFGEKSSSYCGNCLNCQTQFEEVDITLEANTILRCLDALDWNYGAATVIDIVHGGKSQKILGKNLDKNPEYAVLSERTVPRLRQILRELQFREYVEEKGEQYPVICLTPEGKAFMKTEEPLIMKLPKEETEKKSESKEKKNRRKKGAVAAELSEKDAELFESLRELRREIASEEKVPPYMVFADKTLAGMCVMRPATRDEMLEVSGVGEHKLKKYGDRFLEILRKG